MRSLPLARALVTVCAALIATALSTRAQTPGTDTAGPDTLPAFDLGVGAGAPVVFGGDTLFRIYWKVGAFSPRQRALLVAENVRELTALPLGEFDSLAIAPTESGGYEVVYRDQTVNSVTPADAAAEGLEPRAVAQRNRDRIRAALVADYDATSTATLARDVAMFALLLGVLVGLWVGINRGFDFARLRLRQGLRAFIDRHSVGERGKLFRLLAPATQAKLLLAVLRILRVASLLLLLYLFLPFVFSQLAYTRGFGEQLFEYVLRPVRFVVAGAIGFVPELAFILVIGWIGYQFIKLAGWLAGKVADGQITIDGFHSDWALPTANLVRVLIVVLTIIVVYPYLPGSDSDAFKGVSVFLGLLFSLGGAAAIGNVVSGVILTYMRPFQVGHRVKIDDKVGDIVSKNLLVTRIRTTKNEEITVPNGALLSGGIVNYTALCESHGLVLHTSVTIGYDVPWPRVHELLLAAAAKTPGVVAEPAPFILQKALQDWYVEYELNATTRDSHRMAHTYSELHAHIQDAFRDADVEIMSSHYLHVRTGNETTIPRVPAAAAAGAIGG